MDDVFDEKLIKIWKSMHFFNAEKDKFKSKIMIHNSFSKTPSFEFTPSLIYSYMFSDVYNRYNKMLGKNVLFLTGLNNLSYSSYLFSSNHNFDYLDTSNFKKNLDDLGIGHDSNYFLEMSNSKFVKFMDKFFKDNYSKNIFYGPVEVFSTLRKDKYYNYFDVNKTFEKYYCKYDNEEVIKIVANAFYLDIEKYFNQIRSGIENLNISNDYKEKMLEMLGDYSNISIPFNINKELHLDVELEHPEYLAGVSFVALNPLKMDVYKYISSDEYDSCYKYMQNGYSKGVFSGYTLKNPLNYSDICLIISYNFDEAIHVGIPDLSSEDKAFSEEFGFDYVNVIADDHLINSDFLNGYTIDEGRKKAIVEYLKWDFGTEVKHFRCKKIIISSLDNIGAPIPLEVIKDGFDYKVLDSEFFPIKFNKYLKVIYGVEQKKPTQLINVAFNNVYQSSCLYLFMFSNNFIEEKEFLNNIEYFIYEEEIGSEILFPLIFSIVNNSQFLKQNYKILSDSYPNNDEIVDYNNLNIHFITDTLKKYSIDSLRFYFLQESKDSNFEESLIKINRIDSFLKEVYEKYNEDFSDENTENYEYTFNLTNELNKYINSMKLDLYCAKLQFSFNNYYKNKKWTEDEALTYVKFLSIVCPFISQKIFKEIFNQNNYIIFEEWPKN